MTGERELTVVAVFRIRAGDEERFLAAARDAVVATRAERGCVEYALHRGADDPTLFMFHERWRSRADLDRHLAAPHMARFLAVADAVRVGEIDVGLWHADAHDGVHDEQPTEVRP